MKPLLDIQTVPIAIEYKTSAARVSRVGKPAPPATGKPVAQEKPVRASVGRASAPVRTTSGARPKVDTVNVSGRGIARVTPRKPAQATVSFYDAQGNSRSVSYDATAQMMRDGQIMVDLQLSAVQAADAATATAKLDQPSLDDISMMDGSNPDAGLPETLSLTYELEKLQYDLRQAGEGFEFTPANIEFSILEYPRVVIEYIGSPMYVPPSADPNYEPIDLEV